MTHISATNKLRAPIHLKHQLLIHRICREIIRILEVFLAMQLHSTDIFNARHSVSTNFQEFSFHNRNSFGYFDRKKGKSRFINKENVVQDITKKALARPKKRHRSRRRVSSDSI